MLPIHFEAPAADQVEPAALGFKYTLPKAIVYAVDEGSPAQKAGLKTGDELLSVTGNGRSGSGYDGILNIISESKGIPLTFQVRRPETEPQRDQAWDSSENIRSTIINVRITPIEENGRVIVGFVPDYPSDLQKFGAIGAIGQSIRRNYDLSALTFKIIGRIIRGSASVRTLSGPIEIARISGDAARAARKTGSARIFFGFLGLVSLQLGVFNLLPIPILDGGVIALLLIEGLIRREISLNIKEKIVQVGFVFLILLMGFVVFNDLSKIFNFDKIFR
jgi:regulator of sigma E protease